MEFNLPKEHSSIIKVIGVGGGGGNAVTHMFGLGIKGVDFIVCNTDHQALDSSPVPMKIQLGSSLTEGRGAGSIPEIGKNAAIENIDDIREFLANNTKMVFVTAGMGGGTGTGAAPVIAKAARELGILTVGIVTMPFTFEGRKRKEQAEKGLEEMRQAVDTLLVINNDRLREMFGNLSLKTAFGYADDVVTTAAKGIAEVISVTGAINVDFNDVNTVMKGSGVAIMGQAKSEGEDRAIKAVQTALSSPLLNDNDISGAKYVLLNITYGEKEVLMDEISEITDYIQDEAGSTADVIWGHGYDETLGDALSITVIATGFNSAPDTGVVRETQAKKYDLDMDKPHAITEKITSAIDVHEPKESIRKEDDEYPDPYLKDSEEQISFEFEVTKSTKEPEQKTEKQEQSEVKKYSLDDEYSPENKVSENNSSSKNEVDDEKVEESHEQQKLAQERINRIKEISSKLKTPSGLSDLENEPAYKRRKVDLEDVPHSSESSVSKFTLTEDEEDGKKKTGLKENNSFLHDNVD